MGFTVKYNIMQAGKDAPCYSTSDRQLAYAELSDRQRKGNPLDYWMDWDITPHDLNQKEEYMWFVWQIRMAQKKFWRDGKKQEDLLASKAMEEELDRWNAETREKLNKVAYVTRDGNTVYSGWQPSDAEAYQFFVTVEEWRKEWKKYFAAKANGDHETSSRLYQICRSYETRIETYCKLQMKL